jgi:aspartyl-tRNA(Asn)/glutamyl-tRNA(Gln) amidotransferase subunit B
VREYALSDYEAQTLTASKGIAAYFESVAKLVADRKLAANWVMGEVSARLNEAGRDFESVPVDAGVLAQLLNRILDGTITAKTAKDEVLSTMWPRNVLIEAETGVLGITGHAPQVSVDAIIEARGLKQISDTGAIEKIVDEVLAANPKSVEEFRAGKEKAFNALVGQAMKATRGKANPQQVNEILRRRLAG